MSRWRYIWRVPGLKSGVPPPSSMGARWMRSSSTRPCSSAWPITSPPPMITTSPCVAATRALSTAVARSPTKVNCIPSSSFEPNVLRRRVGDHEERRRPRLIRAIPHLLVPTPRAVDDVEQPPPHDHGTTLRRGPFEDLGVDRVLFRHPRVKLGRVAEPVLIVGAGPGHVPLH